MNQITNGIYTLTSTNCTGVKQSECSKLCELKIEFTTTGNILTAKPITSVDVLAPSECTCSSAIDYPLDTELGIYSLTNFNNNITVDIIKKDESVIVDAWKEGGPFQCKHIYNPLNAKNSDVEATPTEDVQGVYETVNVKSSSLDSKSVKLSTLFMTFLVLLSFTL